METGHMGACTEDGTVDIYGKPALKRKTGRWRAGMLLLGMICLFMCFL